jgi:hypothetical protein
MVVLKEKIINDIDVVFDWEVDDTFYWVDSPDYFELYSEIFLNILKNKWFKCKWYDLIHIVASEEFKDGISEGDTSVHKNWSAILSENNYKNWDKSIKDTLALDCIYNWLLDLTKREYWDTDILNEAYEEIQAQWVNTELIFKEAINKKYNLKVTYSQLESELYVIYFTLTDKKTKESYKREMNRWDKDFMIMWLNSIKISSKAIQMRPWVSTYGETTEQFDIHIGNFIKGSNFKNNYKENIIT